MSNLGDVLSKLVFSHVSQTRGLGAEPPTAGGYGGLGAKTPAARQFLYVFGKKAILIPLDHISHVFTAI